MRLKKAAVFISGSLIMTFVYLVLSETYSLKSLGVGALFGVSSMIACTLFFPKAFLERYEIKILPLMLYIIRLIIIIIVSGVKSLIVSYSKTPVSHLFEYKSELKSDMLITLLANSITLTPGTTTIDKNDNVLRVIRLCKKGDEANIDDIKKLERLIKRAQRSAS